DVDGELLQLQLVRVARRGAREEPPAGLGGRAGSLALRIDFGSSAGLTGDERCREQDDDAFHVPETAPRGRRFRGTSRRTGLSRGCYSKKRTFFSPCRAMRSAI